MATTSHTTGSLLRGLRHRGLAVALVVALLATAGVLVLRDGEEPHTVTAHFPRAVSVFVGTDVRVLGVTVGRVTSVTPDGASVAVEMEYDADVRLPADAKAAIVTPTLVADRYVQLTPAYSGGEVLADGADIALPDTGVPVELDRIYRSLRDLSQALGPNGVNRDGTLDNLLRAGDEALSGQGERGNRMIRELSAAATTFGEGSGDLFDTVTELATFTGTLAENDRLVRAFLRDLAGVSADLADERQEISAALAAVARAVIGIHILAQQGDLPHALRSQVPRLHHDVVHRAGKLSATRIGHDTESAELVATFLHREEGGRAIRLTDFGQRVELFERVEFGFQPVTHSAAGACNHLRQLVIGLRSQHEVDQRLAAHDLFAFGLRNTASHGDCHVATGLALHALQLAEFGIDFFGGLFTNMARVQHNEVCRFRRINRRIAERTQYVPHALGIIDIHLAPIGLDEETLGVLFRRWCGHARAYA